jgi:hypothetical protein
MFGPEDRSEGTAAVLVNEALARRSWPGQDGVGRRIRQGGADSTEPWLTVVGVFADARQSSLTEAIRPEIVFPYAQNPVAWYKAATLLVHTRTEPSSVADTVKACVWRVAPDLPITQVKSIGAVLRRRRGGAFRRASCSASRPPRSSWPRGIYAVMAYVVSRRAHEIGIRMALGARAGEVFGTVVGRGLVLGGAGAALGLAGAFATTRLLSSLLFEVRAWDPTIIASVVAVVGTVGVATCGLAARRGLRLNPAAALREE